jgi:hypothetical protein
MSTKPSGFIASSALSLSRSTAPFLDPDAAGQMASAEWIHRQGAPHGCKVGGTQNVVHISHRLEFLAKNIAS